MVRVLRSTTFDRWLRKLKDRRAAARVMIRIDRLAAGNAGDSKPVGDGVSELRIDYGPGYRVYYAHDGPEIVVLLCGGNKSRQQQDITDAKRIAKAWKQMTNVPEEFNNYDTADYLNTPEDAAAYLEAVLEEGFDSAAVAQALGTIARSRNVSELARRIGMSREGLYKALSSDGNPSFATVMKVANALGLRLRFESAA